MDRHWVSLHGNLYSTLVTPPPESLHLLPFAVSLAVYNAIAHHLPEERRNAIGLKWPNDVLIDGAKTSGILIEQRTQAGQPSLIAIGIGINIAHAPDLVDRAVTHLADQGSMSTPGEVFASLRETLAQSLRQLHHAPQAIIPPGPSAQPASGADQSKPEQETLQGTFDHLASGRCLDGTAGFRRHARLSAPAISSSSPNRPAARVPAQTEEPP
jgi:biotin-(acetyl-CoA carboxylase) ligase